jgi:GTP-binding protein
LLKVKQGSWIIFQHQATLQLVLGCVNRIARLPGYGFAHGARKDTVRFNQTVNDYLENRPNLRLVFALIESGLAPQEIDLEFVEWLARHAVPFVFVFTKTDKVSAATAQTNIAAFTDRISAWFEKLPLVFTCSATTRQGRQELLRVIDDEMAPINTAANQTRVSPESSPSPSLEARVRANRKRRPDLNRPW